MHLLYENCHIKLLIKTKSIIARGTRMLNNINRHKKLPFFILVFSLLSIASCSSVSDKSAQLIEHGIAIAHKPDKLLFAMDFANYPSDYQDYTQNMLLADVGEISSRASGEIRGFDSAMKTWPARNQVGYGHLKAEYAANIASGKQTGFLFDKLLPNMELATIEYRVKFDHDFFWASGGKLPGLGGAAEGANIPVGCTQDQNNIKNGFSTRLMWRKNGRIVLYSYFPDRKKRCGEDDTFFTAESGKWYKITQTIALNTPGKRDGNIWMFINDILVYTKNDVFFRESGKDKVKINSAIFHTYRGGGETDKRFHSPRKEHVYFDDIKVWEGKVRDLAYD